MQFAHLMNFPNKRPGNARRYRDFAEAFRVLTSCRWRKATAAGLSQTERDDDAHGGGSDWGLDGSRHQAYRLTR